MVGLGDGKKHVFSFRFFFACEDFPCLLRRCQLPRGTSNNCAIPCRAQIEPVNETCTGAFNSVIDRYRKQMAEGHSDMTNENGLCRYLPVYNAIKQKIPGRNRSERSSFRQVCRLEGRWRAAATNLNCDDAATFRDAQLANFYDVWLRVGGSGARGNGRQLLHGWELRND
jgi:hypothetical protein